MKTECLALIGGVTKNGGSIEYAYDDGFVGSSLEANAYRYLGKNVLSNSSYGLKSTLYVHPLNLPCMRI